MSSSGVKIKTIMNLKSGRKVNRQKERTCGFGGKGLSIVLAITCSSHIIPVVFDSVSSG